MKRIQRESHFSVVYQCLLSADGFLSNQLSSKSEKSLHVIRMLRCDRILRSRIFLPPNFFTFSYPPI